MTQFDSFTPAQDYVLVKKVETNNKIAMPDGVDHYEDNDALFEVLKVGPGKESESTGQLSKMICKPGDKVRLRVLMNGDATDMLLDGKKYGLLRQRSIAGFQR